MKKMKRIKCLVITFLWLSPICAQIPSESQMFLTETLSKVSMGKEELLSKFAGFDYSEIWMKNNSKILGFIGDGYQRLNLKYLAVVKNGMNSGKYYVYGKSRVKSNICQFMGEIELIHIRKTSEPETQELYEEAIKHNDEEAIMRFSKPKYVLLATYHFFENPNQKGTGVFEGVLKTNFYVDNGKVLYDDLEVESDNFSNNQCVGTWISYANGISKRCNWGEYRIHYSGDLDIGAGEFFPNVKYLNKGWNTYYKAFIQNETNSLKEEKFVWW